MCLSVIHALRRGISETGSWAQGHNVPLKCPGYPVQSLQVRCPGNHSPPTGLCHALIGATTHGNMERGNPRTLIVNLLLVFQRPGFPSKTEGAGLGGCCYDATFVTEESLKAVAEMSHSSDPLYVHRAPLRSVRLWVSHLIYLLSCLSAGLSAKDWAAELTRKLQQLKLSLRSGQGNPPCLLAKGEPQGNV